MSSNRVDEALGLLFGGYIVYKVAEVLIASDPSFAKYALGVVAALFAGGIAYLRSQ